MLLQLVFENVLSFREAAILSLRAAPGVAHPPGSVVDVPGVGLVLRVAAVYGANAAGKSNLWRAFAEICNVLRQGVPIAVTLPALVHKLDPAAEREPSRCELELFLEGERWSYGIAFTAKRVEAEWLFRTRPAAEERLVFQREAGSGSRPEIELGPGLGAIGERLAFVKFVAEGTRHEQPFLAECGQRNVEEVGVLRAWLMKGVVHCRPAFDVPDLERFFLTSPHLMRYVAEYVRESSTGVNNLSVKAETRRGLDLRAAIEAEDFQTIQDILREKSTSLQLQFHVAGQAGTVTLAPHEQSDGTLRLIHLVSTLWIAKESGSFVFADELDRSLHTLLTRKFLASFLELGSENHSQLVFTTHDTNLLDLNLLPRDAIWFVDKSSFGASSLYALSEFKGDQLNQLTGHMEEGYLQGRFGAIPFLANPRLLGWARGTP